MTRRPDIAAIFAEGEAIERRRVAALGRDPLVVELRASHVAAIVAEVVNAILDERAARPYPRAYRPPATRDADPPLVALHRSDIAEMLAEAEANRRST